MHVGRCLQVVRVEVCGGHCRFCYTLRGGKGWGNKEEGPSMGGSRSASRPKRQSKKSSVSYVESDDDDEEFLPSSRAGAATADNRRSSNLRGTGSVEDLGIAKGRRTIIVKHPTRPQVLLMLPPLCRVSIKRSFSANLHSSPLPRTASVMPKNALNRTPRVCRFLQIGFLQAAQRTSILWLQTSSWFL